MTAKIINLRRARKSRKREDDRRAADERAARHGLSAAECKLSDRVERLQDRRHAGHRLDEAGDAGQDDPRCDTHDS